MYVVKTALRECTHMHAVKTALRESFYSIHVGLMDLYKVKIETDRGK